MKKILVVDDDAIERRLLQTLLGKVAGYDVLTAEDGRAALERAVPTVNVVLLDLQLPDMSGIEVLKELKKRRPQLPVIMLTGVTDVRVAVEAVQAGALQYLTKPFENDQLLITLRNALERDDLLSEVEELRQRAGTGPALGRLVGQSHSLRHMVAQIQKVAPSNLTVLIQGETGTGKELAARSIHEESPRRGKPFVAIDCGALSENLLETELFGHEKGAFTGADRKKDGQMVLAQGGTLFLDEVGNLPMGLQSKLLRVLQERQVRPVGANRSVPIDVRFVAATNVPLEQQAQEGKYRQDLYYRLAEFTLQLSPLRERMEDLELLARRFLEEAAVEFRKPMAPLDAEALKKLQGYSWPGNIRELRNVVRQAVLLAAGPEVGPEVLKSLLGKGSAPQTGLEAVEVPLAPGLSLKQISTRAAEEAEKQAIRNVLRSTQGNKSQAAKILKTDYKTLFMKVKKYGFNNF